MDVYSTYEAKSRFSEILRKVRAGRRVVVTHHGTAVAEIRPVDRGMRRLEDRWRDLEDEGVVQPALDPSQPIPRLGKRPGALRRFLASRD